MVNLKYIAFAVCFCLVFGCCGCGVVVWPRLVASQELEGVSTFDPADYGFKIYREMIDVGDGTKRFRLQIDNEAVTEIEQDWPVPIKYGMFARTATSKCKIGKKEYPVLFDTGNSGLVHITAGLVRDNELPIYPLEYVTGRGELLDFGVAMIDEMSIGGLSLRNLPGQYYFYHTGYLLFGLPGLEVGRDDEINIGLSVIKRFKYVAFDDKSKQMEFSLDESFEPGNSQDWKSYKLTVTDKGVYIEATLEAVAARLIVDTGSEAELLLMKSCFNSMVKNRPELGKSWKMTKEAFAPLAGGEFECESYFVSGLAFDGYEYNLPSVILAVDEGVLHDHLLANEYDGIIGLPFFKGTVMVLDFEGEKMWVKKASWSRFER